MKQEIQKAVNVLNKGGIIIFPTDTTYGIGCRMDDEKAVKRLFKIRRRPKNQATSVLVDSIGMVKEYVESIDKDVEEKLMKNYWPGALTIVLECKKEKISALVRGGGDTLGVRMPDYNTILAIIKEVGVPILGPSANFHREPTPFIYEDLNKELIKKVDFIIHGTCKIKKPSTIIDVKKKPWKIIRQGAIKLEL